MSIFYDVKPEDLSMDKGDLRIWVSSDYNGNSYATVPIKTILWYLKKEGLLPGKAKKKG